MSCPDLDRFKQRRASTICVAVLALMGGAMVFVFALPAGAQQDGQAPVFRVEVDLVLLNIAVTDRGGRYIRGLRPEHFRVFEDGIPQKLAGFGEAGGRTEQVSAERPLPADLAGSNIFILFDTSNFMYKGFVYAQDAISDFIRSLEPADSVAVYGFSRNLLRASPLTPDRRQALVGVREVVAGDDTSLYNALLLTLQDAARVPGRKVVVVFSNGPDNSSMISPEAVREFAESEGIAIYMISTQELAKDEISAAVFERLASRSGGKAYFARTWQKQAEAFTSVREDLANLYLLSYYPAQNANTGWRTITVELSGEQYKKLRIRTRTGYRPKQALDQVALPGVTFTAGQE